MARINCGDIKLFSIDHPSVDSFNMTQKSEESTMISNKKGWVVDSGDTQRGANGTRINKMNAKNPKITSTVLAELGLLDSIEEVVASTEEATITILMSNGEIYTASGMFVGDNEEDAQNGTIAFEFQCSGEIKAV